MTRAVLLGLLLAGIVLAVRQDGCPHRSRTWSLRIGF